MPQQGFLIICFTYRSAPRQSCDCCEPWAYYCPSLIYTCWNIFNRHHLPRVNKLESRAGHALSLPRHRVIWERNYQKDCPPSGDTVSTRIHVPSPVIQREEEGETDQASKREDRRLCTAYKYFIWKLFPDDAGARTNDACPDLTESSKFTSISPNVPGEKFMIREKSRVPTAITFIKGELPRSNMRQERWCVETGGTLHKDLVRQNKETTVKKEKKKELVTRIFTVFISKYYFPPYFPETLFIPYIMKLSKYHNYDHWH